MADTDEDMLRRFREAEALLTENRKGSERGLARWLAKNDPKGASEHTWRERLRKSRGKDRKNGNV